MTMIIFMMAITSIMFMLLNHPLSFGATMLIMSILIAMISGLMNSNFWFSYILVLIMVGGMLVLFIYMTSIASNEKFKFSNTSFMLILTSIIISMFMLLIMDHLPNEMPMNQDLTQINTNISIPLSKYFNWPNKIMIIILMNYLLMTMVMTASITKSSHGPLRQF